jgi:hypothetical protein
VKPRIDATSSGVGSYDGRRAELRTIGGRFHLAPQDAAQIERQQRQQERGLVLREGRRGEVRPDRSVELAEAVLERAATTIMRQQFLTAPLRFGPIGHQEEAVGQQLQLTGLGIGPVHDHQQQTLGMPPGLDLI